MKPRILVVDDEQSMRDFLAILLEREGYTTDRAEDAETAIEMLPAGYDLVISDVCMPGLDGLALLRTVKMISPETAMLLVTAYTTSEQAVEAMKLGAYDYIGKPFQIEEIKVLVRNALEKRELQQENLRLKREVTTRYSFSGLVGKSKKMQEIYSLIEKISLSMVNVLISGESGTGKELVAKAIHYNSPRKDKPFVAVNCGAIPETLMESELFGHKKGSFTGAITDRPGLFSQAEGGTLFLDEIGEVPLQLQTKLLRVLQEREFRRVGGAQDVKADVRVIAASNRDLAELVREGSFREDLFYRINVIQLHMPPLRERPEDIPLLVEHFFNRHLGKSAGVEPISVDALKALESWLFPGNVRELENLVERAVALGSRQLHLGSLPSQVLEGFSSLTGAGDLVIHSDGIKLELILDALEKRYLTLALMKTGGSKKKAAEVLGLSFRSFRYRLAKFQMDGEE